MKQILQVLSSFVKGYKKPLIALAISLGLLAVSGVVVEFIQKKDAQTIELTNDNLMLIARKQVMMEAMTDSINYYRSEYMKLQKLIIITELTIRQKPNEKTIRNNYAAMPDSTALRLFNERYGQSELLADQPGR